MSITAKELAKKLGLSETAVSMALNNKPGVSTNTRKRVIEAAEQAGYDFERINAKSQKKGSIYFISYRSSNVILSYNPIFDELWEGLVNACQKRNYPVRMLQVYEKLDNLDLIFEEIRGSDCVGIILVGTEMKPDKLRAFMSLGMPITLLDSQSREYPCNSVLINNFQGAYIATNYLIAQYRETPGYLQSAYTIANFEERTRGFHKALNDNGMSRSHAITHQLAPSIEYAMADMLEVIDSGEKLARCYYSDNDAIAIGAIKALKLRGYRIPEDVAVMGFDNISEARIIEPALTTMDVPRYFIGSVAADNLIGQIENKYHHVVNVEILPTLTRRFST
ncbi:MAG: LacI family DNA-binding transcriptional regulator [Lachnospiraceae bacterium]|nr:LacI family DNA-binding transcriptional regulator [Lachnospiraceae bacterium]